MYLRAGGYEVTVRKPGYKDATQAVEVSEGKLVALRLTLESLTPEPAPVTSATEGSAEVGLTVQRSQPDEGPGMLPWITMGVGGAATITGIVLVALAEVTRGEMTAMGEEWTQTDDVDVLSAEAARFNDLKESRAAYNVGAGITLALGVAGVAGGLVWMLLAGEGDDTTPQARATPQLLLTPTPAGAFGHASWRF